MRRSSGSLSPPWCGVPGSLTRYSPGSMSMELRAPCPRSSRTDRLLRRRRRHDLCLVRQSHRALPQQGRWRAEANVNLATERATVTRPEHHRAWRGRRGHRGRRLRGSRGVVGARRSGRPRPGDPDAAVRMREQHDLAIRAVASIAVALGIMARCSGRVGSAYPWPPRTGSCSCPPPSSSSGLAASSCARPCDWPDIVP